MPRSPCCSRSPSPPASSSTVSTLLDTVGDGTRYITFGAGAEIEMEYAFTQTSTLEQVVGYAAEAEFSASLFAESKLNIVGVESEEEMALTTKGSVAVELGRSGEKSQARSHAVSISLGDEDSGDVFAVKIETDTVYGTPIFTTIGGESTCPGETATTRRAEDVTIFDIIPHCQRGAGARASPAAAARHRTRAGTASRSRRAPRPAKARCRATRSTSGSSCRTRWTSTR